MELLIFKTDIKTKKKIKEVGSVFKNHPIIMNWSIDTEDIDNVLRIEASGNLSEGEIIHLITTCGFYCEALPD